MAKKSKNAKQISGYKGEVTPKELRDGPLKKRPCTDCLCMLIFMLFWAGLVSMGHYAYLNGDPDHLSYPYDSAGTQCGVGDAEGFPYIYFVPVDGNFSGNSTVCIDQCPTDPGQDRPDPTNCFPEEKEIEGNNTQGSSTQSSNTQGSNTHGSNTYFSTTQSSNTYGSTTQGSSTYGSNTQGSNTYGSNTQGSSTQGSGTQGSSTQGSSTQGSSTQGNSTQGSKIISNKTNCIVSKPYWTTTIADKFCIPSNGTDVQNLYNSSAMDLGFTFQAVQDVQKTLWVNIIVGLVALFLGYIYIVLLKHFSALLTWGLLMIFILLIVGFGYICYEDSQGTEGLDEVTPADLADIDPKYLEFIAYGCFFIAFIALLLVCIFRSKINLSIAVLKAATDFLDDQSALLYMPIFFLITTCTFYIGWIYIAVRIVGMNDLIPNDEGTPGGQIDWSMESQGMIAYYIFAIFWNHTFGVALAQFIIASTACLWYFKQGKSNLEGSLFWISVRRSMLHMGSLALASFIVGLFDFLRAFLDWWHKKLKIPDDEETGSRGVGSACCDCIMGCFERSLRFVNRHAYIQIAMRGQSFCQASQESFYLLLRNKVRFGMVHGLAWIFLQIGQIFIAVCSTFVGFYYITETGDYAETTYSPFGPSIFFFLISWMIARIFMSIYGISADTIIHCFAMDEEMNEGFATLAPKQLREFVDDTLHKKLLIED